jgi:signal transduction histidine kinase
MENRRMKKICIAVVLLIISGMAFSLSADSQTAQDQVKIFVGKAFAYAKKHGRKAAVKAFMDKNGKFQQGDLYVFAYDFNGIVLSLPTDPNFVGSDFLYIQDRDGKQTIQEMIKVLKKDGEGWVQHVWVHPKTRKLMKKMSFVRKVDDTWFLGSGAYMD